MPTDFNVALQQIDEVLSLYNELRQRSQYEDCSDLTWTKGRQRLIEVAARLSSALARLAPPGSRYERALADLDKDYGPSSPENYLATVPGLLMALRSDYEAGILQSTEKPVGTQGRESGSTVFISCGQATAAERKLGLAVSKLVQQLTPHQPYFAQNQSSLDGLTKNILEALNDSVGLIAIMHPRGKVISPGNTQHTRASVWIEQEIAIAAFITQALKRPIRVNAYIHVDVGREGMRDQLQLNPVLFSQDEEILAHLKETLPRWGDSGASRERPEALPWEPDARIENQDHQNSLILKSDREFRIRRIVLKGPSGATMRELAKSPDWDRLESRGYRVPIPVEALTDLWNNSDGPSQGQASASIGYELSAGGQGWKFSLPIALTQDFYSAGGASIAWIRATG